MHGPALRDEIGGITSRSVLSQVAKGNHRGVDIGDEQARIYPVAGGLVADESTIIWCLYNDEQDVMERRSPTRRASRRNTPMERARP